MIGNFGTMIGKLGAPFIRVGVCVRSFLPLLHQRSVLCESVCACMSVSENANASSHSATTARTICTLPGVHNRQAKNAEACRRARQAPIYIWRSSTSALRDFNLRARITSNRKRGMQPADVARRVLIGVSAEVRMINERNRKVRLAPAATGAEAAELLRVLIAR